MRTVELKKEAFYMNPYTRSVDTGESWMSEADTPGLWCEEGDNGSIDDQLERLIEVVMVNNEWIEV